MFSSAVFEKEQRFASWKKSVSCSIQGENLSVKGKEGRREGGRRMKDSRKEGRRRKNEQERSIQEMGGR